MPRAILLMLGLVLLDALPARAQRTPRNGQPPVVRIQTARPGMERGAARLPVYRPIPLVADTVPFSVLATLFPGIQPTTPFILSARNLVEEGRGLLVLSSVNSVDPRDDRVMMLPNGIVTIQINAQAGKTYVVEFVGRHACQHMGDPCPADRSITLQVHVNGQGGAQPLTVPVDYPVGITGFHAPTAGAYYIHFQNGDYHYLFQKVRVRAVD